MADLNLKVRSRPKGWTRKGSVLSGKGLTEGEARLVQAKWMSDKQRWERLISPPLNKWTKDGLPLTPKSRK